MNYEMYQDYKEKVEELKNKSIIKEDRKIELDLLLHIADTLDRIEKKIN